jgi:hypothetical protein
MLELKHAYFAYTRSDNPRETVARFHEALRQLETLEKRSAEPPPYGNGLRKIAWVAVVFYRDSLKEGKLKTDLKSQNFGRLYKKLLRNTKLEQSSNLNALWLLSKRLVIPLRFGNKFEIYPAVAFIGHASDIVQLKQLMPLLSILY